VIGLLLGIATVVALLTLSSALTVEAQNNLEHFGANIIVAPGESGSASTYQGVPLDGSSSAAGDIREADLERIAAIPNSKNIAILAPALLGVVTTAAAGDRDGATEVLLKGVRPEEEFRLKQWWTIEGRALQGPSEVVAGSTLAVRLRLAPGAELVIDGQSFTVTGVLQPTGSQDDDLLLGELGMAQRLLAAPGRVTMVEIAALCSDCPVEEIVAQVGEVLPGTKVTALRQIVENRMDAMEQFRTFSYIAVGVIVAIELLVVFVAMMGAVTAGTREIGIFRALGFRRAHVASLVLSEAALAGLTAGILGYLAGMGVSYALLPFLSQDVPVTWTPWIGALAVVLSTTIGAIASLYPALRASRLDPAQALRTL
jgi:putative ABC transport system permease protein